MPEKSNFYFDSYFKIFKKRGIKSLYDEIKDNLFFDIINGTSTQIREGKSTNKYKHYSPAYSSLIKEAIKFLNINYSEYDFIDFGSGKGKVTLIASHFKFKKIIGIEIIKSLIKESKSNQKIYFDKIWNKNFRCRIEYICLDAEKYKIVSNQNVFFMFDPFTEKKLIKILEKIAKIKSKNNYLITFNPPKIMRSGKKFKLLKTFYRNTYSAKIFRIR